MTGVTKAATSRIFYGWWLVVVCMLFLAVGTGTSVYLYSVIAGALETEYPGGRLLLMMGITLFFLTGGIMSPRIGRFIDRHPLKHVLAVGGVVLGIGFLLIATSTGIKQVLVAYAVFIAMGNAILGGMASATLLSRWFVKHRGFAIGIASLGTQVGGLVFPPVIARLMEIYDWRIAVMCLAVFCVIAVPLLVYLTVRDHPSDMGLGPDGGPPAPVVPAGERTGTSGMPYLSMAYLVRQKNFVMATLCIGLVSVVNTAIIANLALFAIDIGENRERGAYLVSLLSLLGMFSSPLVGRWCDVWNIKRVAQAMFLLSATASVVFLIAGDYRMLVVATFIQGIAGGSVMPLWAALVARISDNRYYGQIFGAVTVFVFAMIAVAPMAAGWMYDMTQNYRVFFFLAAAFMLLATVLVTLMKLPESDKQRLGATETRTAPVGT